MVQKDSTKNTRVIDFNAARQKYGAQTHGVSGSTAANAAANGHAALLQRIRNAEDVYSVVSAATKLPYVFCDEKTCDDAVYLYFSQQSAAEKAKELIAGRFPVGVLKVDQKSKLSFLSTLFTMGVNALFAEDGKNGILLQLSELIVRKAPDKLPENAKQIENPSLQLTAIYYAQETRRPNAGEESERAKELQEEMLADFRRSELIMAFEKGGKNTPLLKLGEDAFHPLFTDMHEFARFNREGKFAAAVLKPEDLAKALSPNAKGVCLNPLGVNIILNIGRRRQENASIGAQAQRIVAEHAENGSSE